MLKEGKQVYAVRYMFELLGYHMYNMRMHQQYNVRIGIGIELSNI